MVKFLISVDQSGRFNFKILFQNSSSDQSSNLPLEQDFQPRDCGHFGLGDTSLWWLCVHCGVLLAFLASTD
jgi:hypothetical protein